MPLNPNGYPLDLTGLAPSNLITDETHLFNEPSERLFVPSGGPFYHIGLSIRNSANNQLLLPNTDYKLLHLHKPAARESGKDVYAVVYIINENIPGIIMDYRVVGGIHGETASVIRTLLESFPLPNNGNNVSWGQLIGVPTQFTPAEHLHHIDEIYNFNDVVSVLEQLRIAILAGDGPAINAIYQYFHQYLTNADYVTRDELLSITSIAPFFEIKSFPDYATLRNATTMINGAPGIYCCLGRDNMFDGNGRIFLWDIDSVAPHNGDTVIRPLITPDDSVNGRFISFQRVEKDLNLLAVSLQRSINFDGTIEDGIIQNGRVVVGDCDNYLRDGTYWVGDANTITNAPFSWCVMEVDNIVVAAGSTYGEVIQTFYNGFGKKCTRIRYFDVGVNGFIWSAMRFYARREGDDAIQFFVNDATQPKHAVNLEQLQNYPGNPNIKYNVDTPTSASHAVNLSTFVRGLECNLVVAPVYLGQTSLLVAGSLYDATASTYVNVPLNTGEWVGIFCTDIESLAVPNFSNKVVTIYLEYNYDGNGNNRLNWTGVTEDILLNNFSGYSYSNKRRPSYIGGHLMIAIAWIKDNQWEMVRNWHQDTGMFMHKGLYNSPRPDINTLPTINGPLAIIDFDDTNVNETYSPVFTSPFYGAPISSIDLLVWAGELVDVSLDFNYTVDSAVAGLKTGSLQLIGFSLDPYNGLGTLVVNNKHGVVSRGTLNENANNIVQSGYISSSFIADRTGVYTFGLYVGTQDITTKIYMRGRHSDPFSTSRLQVRLSEYLAYADPRISIPTLVGVTHTVNLVNDAFNVDLFTAYNNQYGPLSNTPLLTEIIFVIQNIRHGQIVVPGTIPDSIKVKVVVINSMLLGQGGQGGWGTGTNRATRTGQNGTDAIFAVRTFTLVISGNSRIGGGGGGGGAGTRQDQPQQAGFASSGGGGAGYPAGVAGQVQTTGIANGDGIGQRGQDGTDTVGGVGGVSTETNVQNGDKSKGGDGGKGGDIGQNGSNGTNGISHYSDYGNYGLGGTAGKAINVIGASAPITIERVGANWGVINGAISSPGGVINVNS